MAKYKILVITLKLSRLIADEQKMANVQQIIAACVLVGMLVNMVLSS